MSDLSKTESRWVRFAFSYFFLILFGATMLVPLMWMLKTSFQPDTADVMDTSKLLPDEFRIGNYSTVVTEMNFGQAIGNSVLVTLLTTLGLVTTSSLAAFAFARLRFFGRDQIFFGYLATLMIPSSVTMIPVFILLRELGWVDTYYALIIPPMFSAYGVFMLRQFFLSIPRELEEAAIIDGCSAFGIYWRVILPLAKPALAALTILTFMGSWRSFMWPVIVTHSREMATLPVALTQFTEMFSVKWNLLMAGSVIMVLPMILVFVIGQRFFIEGIQLGAVKG
jgi:multiple sugar transport system permease protein